MIYILWHRHVLKGDVAWRREGEGCRNDKNKNSVIRYFRRAISTASFLTKLTRIDSAQCPLPIGAILIENDEV